METFHPPKDTDETKENNALPDIENLSDKWLIEKLDSLIPLIQERWPSIAKQTIEASKGKIDDLVNIISNHTGKSSAGIKEQLFDIIDNIGFFLIGLSIFGLNVLFNSSSNSSN